MLGSMLKLNRIGIKRYPIITCNILRLCNRYKKIRQQGGLLSKGSLKATKIPCRSFTHTWNAAQNDNGLCVQLMHGYGNREIKEKYFKKTDDGNVSICVSFYTPLT